MDRPRRWRQLGMGDASPVLEQASDNMLANDKAAAGANKRPDRQPSVTL